MQFQFSSIDFYGLTRIEETKFNWDSLDTAIRVALNGFESGCLHDRTNIYRLSDNKLVAVVHKDKTITLNPTV